MFWLVYINVQKITHLAQNVKYFSYSLDDSFSQLSKEVRLLCWDSRKSKQRKWSDVFQKIQVDINFILICGTKLRTFKQKVRPQWILLWCIFMWKKLGTNLSTPWKIYLRPNSENLWLRLNTSALGHRMFQITNYYLYYEFCEMFLAQNVQRGSYDGGGMHVR